MKLKTWKIFLIALQLTDVFIVLGEMLISEASRDVLKCLVWSKTQRRSVHCHRGRKKPENIHVKESGIRKLLTPFLHHHVSGRNLSVRTKRFLLYWPTDLRPVSAFFMDITQLFL